MVITVTAEDYCGIQKESCKGRRHIACNHIGYWAITCPRERTLVPFNIIHKAKIVDLHNSLRSKIASGGENGFKPAARMATMVSIRQII
jgi:hypothetical protein